ncbi:MAG TPA: helix-turn-helix domain-containing protein [Streptosporangiaceae bacterium]
MSRYHLLPSPAQEAVLRDHCGHARFVWNLAVEQHRHWHPGRASAPGYLEQCRQLTTARARRVRGFGSRPWRHCETASSPALGTCDGSFWAPSWR